MRAEQLGFDLCTMIEPKSHADFMALANEALSEIKIFNAHMSAILADAPIAAAV